MITPNNITTYSVLTILVNTGKRSFENLGRVINRSGDSIRRMLRPATESLQASQNIAKEMFGKKKELKVLIDATRLKKMYAQNMQGTTYLFDTKIRGCFQAYNLLVAAISDGHFTVPVAAAFTFGKEFYENIASAQEITSRYFINMASKLFPNASIIAVLDGAFATTEYLRWAVENNVKTEVRMHSNRVVKFEGQMIQIRNIKKILPKGLKMARTVLVTWKDIPLYLTAVRRIDKHGDETIVYQVATYEAKPSKHAQTYKQRWPIEKLFRTGKQSLGLQDCFSTKIVTQFDHVCAVLLAYSIVQLELKENRYKNAEEAIRAFKRKDDDDLVYSITALGEIFGVS